MSLGFGTAYGYTNLYPKVDGMCFPELKAGYFFTDRTGFYLEELNCQNISYSDNERYWESWENISFGLQHFLIGRLYLKGGLGIGDYFRVDNFRLLYGNESLYKGLGFGFDAGIGIELKRGRSVCLELAADYGKQFTAKVKSHAFYVNLLVTGWGRKK